MCEMALMLSQSEWKLLAKKQAETELADLPTRQPPDATGRFKSVARQAPCRGAEAPIVDGTASSARSPSGGFMRDAKLALEGVPESVRARLGYRCRTVAEKRQVSQPLALERALTNWKSQMWCASMSSPALFREVRCRHAKFEDDGPCGRRSSKAREATIEQLRHSIAADLGAAINTQRAATHELDQPTGIARPQPGADRC